MRILITSFTYAPQRNGVAETVGRQVDGFLSAGHEVTIATAVDRTRTASNDARVRVLEFDVHSGKRLGTSSGPDRDAYQKAIRTASVDVILCHAWQNWATDLAVDVLPDCLASRKIMVSHGFSAHRWHPQPKFAWGLYQWWQSRRYVRELPRRLKSFDHVVFLSRNPDRNRFYDHLILDRCGGPTWSAIPNGASLEVADAALPKFRDRHSLGGAFVLLYVGLFVNTKNQEAAVRAFFKARIPNSVLVLIGNQFNDYVDHLRRVVADLQPKAGQQRVLFLEHQSRAEIAAAYCESDIFVMSSKYETQPLVLLDAMAAGKPFVSTRVGGVPELPGGLVVDGIGEMARRLHELYASTDRRKALGEEGAKAVRERYNWKSYQSAYNALVAELVR